LPDHLSAGFAAFEIGPMADTMTGSGPFFGAADAVSL